MDSHFVIILVVVDSHFVLGMIYLLFNLLLIHMLYFYFKSDFEMALEKLVCVGCKLLRLFLQN